jgi:uncharacterized protein YcbK (DUF882 family)
MRPRARELVEKILDPLVDAWGDKVNMSSGFRSKALNDALPGSSKTSAHMEAYAADLIPANTKRLEEFKKFVMDWLFKNNIEFDQYINEYRGKSSWVHIAIKNSGGN